MYPNSTLHRFSRTDNTQSIPGDRAGGKRTVAGALAMSCVLPALIVAASYPVLTAVALITAVVTYVITRVNVSARSRFTRS